MRHYELTIQGRTFIAPGARRSDAIVRATDAAGITTTEKDDAAAWESAREVVWSAAEGRFVEASELALKLDEHLEKIAEVNRGVVGLIERGVLKVGKQRRRSCR